MIRNLHSEVLIEIRHDIQRLEAELAQLRAVERYHTGKVGDGFDVNEPADAQTAEESVRNNGERAYAGMTVRDAAKDVLQRAGGGPLSTRAITDKLLAGGYQTKNANQFRNAVFGVLNKSKNIFEKAGAGMWRLRGAATRDSEKDGFT
jgi:hypothetical protein